MKKVLRWRYYCEHCKKAGGSAFHIRNHENGCTANPQRICQMCHMAGMHQTPVAELVAVFLNAGANDEALTALREAADGCPACMLAAIRQSKVQHAPEDEDDSGFYLDKFDFKQEKVKFWQRVESDRWDGVARY